MTKEFWVISFTDSYGVEVCRAKYDEDKEQYAEWCRDLMMVGLGERTPLKHINPIHDRPDRKPDGMFNGSNNAAYIISDAEREQWIALDAERAAAAAAKEKAEEIESIKASLAQAEKSTVYPTKDEADKAHKQYNDLWNEGGSGYVPHMWTQTEVDNLSARLTAATQG